MICLIISQYNVQKEKLQGLSIEVWREESEECILAGRKRAHYEINNEDILGPVQPEAVSVIHQTNRFYEID